MEYTIKKLANMAGISTRTLRYYDEIGILKPARINTSGYRIYAQKEIDILQQVMFYKELGMELDDIKEIIKSPDFDGLSALAEHKKKLIEKKKQLDILIANVDKTIAVKEGRIKMTDKEKFEGFKQNMLDENEKEYGKEIREKYGEDAVEASNKMVQNMTKEQYDKWQELSVSISETLKEAIDTGEPAGELAQKVADMHRQWLGYTWKNYSKEAHAGLAQMYVYDERFKDYYDKLKPGAAEFLRDAILFYTK
ncbi:MAG: MerR family transcriptional regulator [Clostridiales bacterium]|nr:MerR family transcriptional regulator [Clostridiales bacterium]